MEISVNSATRQSESKLESKPAIDISCPVCGYDKSETVCDQPRIVRCIRCRHGFRQNRNEGLSRSYSGRVRMPSYFESRMFADHHYRFIEENIGFRYISNILEIGPGDGALLKMIRKHNRTIDLYAVEPSEYHCRNLERIEGVNVINGYIEDVYFEKEFDLVIMSHILEHVDDPVGVLKYIHDKIQKAGGYLYIDVPSQDFELAGPRMASMATPTHLHFFNGATFHEVLSRAGFSGNHMLGAKYATIPVRYQTRMELISTFKNSGRPFDKIRLFRQKALNRSSILLSAPARVLTRWQPPEIPLETHDSRYNNMAIIVRK